jgi:hypothetical protein
MRTFEMTIKVQVPDNFTRNPFMNDSCETIEHLTELLIHGKSFSAYTKIWEVEQIQDFHIVPDSAVESVAESDFTEDTEVDEDIYVLPRVYGKDFI